MEIAFAGMSKALIEEQIAGVRDGCAAGTGAGIVWGGGGRLTGREDACA